MEKSYDLSSDFFSSILLLFIHINQIGHTLSRLRRNPIVSEQFQTCRSCHASAGKGIAPVGNGSWSARITEPPQLFSFSSDERECHFKPNAEIMQFIVTYPTWNQWPNVESECFLGVFFLFCFCWRLSLGWKWRVIIILTKMEVDVRRRGGSKIITVQSAFQTLLVASNQFAHLDIWLPFKNL